MEIINIDRQKGLFKKLSVLVYKHVFVHCTWYSYPYTDKSDNHQKDRACNKYKRKCLHLQLHELYS